MQPAISKKFKQKHGALFMSQSDNWLTPADLFDKLRLKWRFDLDPCANKARPLPGVETNIYAPEQDGLAISWAGRRVFCNPPYSQISKWVEKAHSHKHEALTVMLIPARCDTIYWHKWIVHALKIELLPGRLRFERADGQKATSAPFPSALIYW